jgi:triacylglycerol esterase/lipase EstA (alpha/beta hydrolase family)
LAAEPPSRGVVLVHGYCCNRGLWNPWLEQLRARAVPAVAVDLEPVFGSIDDYAPIVEAAVRTIEQSTGRPPVLVGHSMGGLAIRAWLRQAGPGAIDRVHHIVTIGSPHHGTWLGRAGHTTNARQMRLRSPWLQALVDAESPGQRHRFTCFWSHCDNIVFPASSATLPGADNRHLEAVAHVDLVNRREVLAEVIERVNDPARAPLTHGLARPVRPERGQAAVSPQTDAIG